MKNSVSFLTNTIFLDKANFPYGFARSGEFTISQALLIESHGHAYKGLASGQREPVTDEERAFVDFCQFGKSAETEHEKTWGIYCKKLSRKTNYVSMQSGPIVRAMDETAELIED